jgi:hypothetical protein
VGVKAKHPKQKKPFIEAVSGDDLHRKSQKWMKLERVVDRDKNQYSETITDPSTGKVVHQCKEPLTKHRGHGSAKKR